MTNVPKTEQSIIFTRTDRACLPIQHIGLWPHSWARLWWHNPRRRERLQSAFLNHTAELRGRCWDLFAIDRYRGTRSSGVNQRTTIQTVLPRYKARLKYTPP